MRARFIDFPKYSCIIGRIWLTLTKSLESVVFIEKAANFSLKLLIFKDFCKYNLLIIKYLTIEFYFLSSTKVSTNKLQLSTILPSLSKSAGKANVVFFQNNWDVFTEIDKYLKPEQYFFAFPFMVGGGKEDKSIHCAISGLKYSNTPLGEKDGRTTPRVEKLSIILDKANLKPVGKSSVSCPLKPSDSAPLKHSTMPP